MKTLFYSASDGEQLYIQQHAAGAKNICFSKDRLSMDTAGHAKFFNAISITGDDGLSNEVLQALYQFGVRYISLRTEGVTHADFSEAIKLGMVISYVPRQVQLPLRHTTPAD